MNTKTIDFTVFYLPLRDCFLKSFQDTDDTADTVCHGKTFKKTVLFRVVREIRAKNADSTDLRNTF